LGQPIIATEQYPKGLGPTLPDLLPKTLHPLPKTTFDATATPAIANRLASVRAVVVAGAEAHVCVLQTVLSLRAQGRAVWVVADATGSRDPANHAAALSRMAAHGAEIVTTEMVLFESLRDAAHPQFRAISALIKASGPQTFAE
jgi:nicotinamidase-related amidase